MVLKQKQADQRREFELVNDVLKVKYAAWFEVKEWTVNIENIGDSIVYNSATRRTALIMTVLMVPFLVFITIALFMSDDVNGNLPIVVGSYLICCLVMSLGWFLPLKKEIHLVGGAVNLDFFSRQPFRRGCTSLYRSGYSPIEGGYPSKIRNGRSRYA